MCKFCSRVAIPQPCLTSSKTDKKYQRRCKPYSEKEKEISTPAKKKKREFKPPHHVGNQIDTACWQRQFLNYCEQV